MPRASSDGASSGERTFDLAERTAVFGESVIEFAKRIQTNPVKMRMIPQLVAAATSVGANYCEADDAVSKREFRKNIGTCRKEASETKHWIRMIVKAEPELKDSAKPLWQEAKELHLIFSRIFRTVSGAQ